MSLASKNSKSVLVLSACTISYFAVQWLGASTMGGSRIFSPSAKADRADFAMMVNRISAAARTECASGTPRTILFEDEDVVTPYIVGVADPLGQCVVARLTPVTPLTVAEAEQCGNLLVTESPPPWSVNPRYKTVPDPNFAAHQWVELDRWSTTDRRFGFTIYRHPCATPVDRKE